MALNDPILTRIVVQRNQSLTGRGLIAFLLLGGLPSLVFVAFGVLGGWWPIVGFCTGVFILVAGALYVVMTAARNREVITITAQHVIVEAGRGGPQMRVRLDRYWARVESCKSPVPALDLISRDVVVEIAAALSPSERKELARRLAALIGPDAPMPDAASLDSRKIEKTRHPRP